MEFSQIGKKIKIYWLEIEKIDKLVILVLIFSFLIRIAFLFYFLIRDKSLKFLKDKYLWYAIGIFFWTLVSWFIYSFKYYGNILGAFIHGFKAAGYWGGVQSWNFFFVNSWQTSHSWKALCFAQRRA